MLGVQVDGTVHLLETSLDNVNHKMDHRKLDQRVKWINFPGHRLLLNAKNTFRHKISCLRNQGTLQYTSYKKKKRIAQNTFCLLDKWNKSPEKEESGSFIFHKYMSKDKRRQAILD